MRNSPAPGNTKPCVPARRSTGLTLALSSLLGDKPLTLRFESRLTCPEYGRHHDRGAVNNVKRVVCIARYAGRNMSCGRGDHPLLGQRQPPKNRWCSNEHEARLALLRSTVHLLGECRKSGNISNSSKSLTASPRCNGWRMGRSG